MNNKMQGMAGSPLSRTRTFTFTLPSTRNAHISSSKIEFFPLL